VVTGASTGLGEAIARAMAGAGAAVVGLARRFASGPLARPAAGQVAGAALDVTDEAAVEARFDEIGAPDALVCCAGVGVFTPFAAMRAADLRAMLDVHIVGSFLCARAMLARRPAGARTGHIIMVSSLAAVRTFTDCAGYTAAKEGLRGMTRVLAEEARPRDVRVTNLIPGAVDTAIWDDRPGFDRAVMLRADDVAGLVVEVVARPELAVEELLVVPPRGAL
jgi:NADP-dependent 3-hydroxy acid dehydrogenase YdfG